MDLSQGQNEAILAGHRSRSNTAVSMKGRKRQLSRGSTTSIHSTATHSLHEQQLPGSPTEYQQQWFDNEQRRGYNESMTTDDAMGMQAAARLQNAREYGIDPALGAAVNHTLGIAAEGAYRADSQRQSLPGDGYGTSFVEDDSQMLENRSEEQDDIDSVAGGVGPAKKSGKSTAANELEMRKLFHDNKDRSLPDVASELHGNERGPQSERTRQVFAMLWINQVCDKGKGSVPRGRVYANYVSRCATERVTVLNPASFGKLVRVLFPGLKTRRLGVRGESKYHYVNFSLKEDQPDLAENPQVTKFQLMKSEPKRFQQENMVPSHLQPDRAAFPASQFQASASSSTSKTKPAIDQSRSLYNQPVLHNMDDLQQNGKIAQHLRFAPPDNNSGHEYEPIVLPKIDSFVPMGTDPDAATALTALYRSHCTSLVDAIRFVKQKTFFHLFTSFHGTLTMPVQKLFAHSAVAPWVEECDFVMYQKMITLLGHLTLEVVPQQILDTLHAISERLVPHIKNSFQGQPAHVVKAKVAPATLFAALLDRMCRVNLTAHAAANMLSHPPNRDQMYEDWISMVRLRKVAEGIPSRAMDDVVMLILSNLRELLDPISVPWEVESVTPYGDIAAQNVGRREASIHADASTENVLDRWVNFLVAIPAKFSYATPSEIIWCIDRVGTAVMRDITIKSGQSFGAWWVTKCWIDEMISFMAEKGGFLDYKTSDTLRPQQPVQPIPQHNQNAARPHAGMFNNPPSQNQTFNNQQFLGNLDGMDDMGNMGNMNNMATMSNMGGINGMNGSRAHNGHTHHVIQGPMDQMSQAAMNAAAGQHAQGLSSHDDSGIGMRTPDDEFSMSKFSFDNTPGMGMGVQMTPGMEAALHGMGQ